MIPKPLIQDSKDVNQPRSPARRSRCTVQAICLVSRIYISFWIPACCPEPAEQWRRTALAHPPCSAPHSTIPQRQFPVERVERLGARGEGHLQVGRGGLQLDGDALVLLVGAAVLLVVRLLQVDLLVGEHGPHGKGELAEVEDPGEREPSAQRLSSLMRMGVAHIMYTVTPNAPLAMRQLPAAP